MYDEYRTVNASLKNQMLAVFDKLYLATFKNGYTEYSTRSTMDLLTHIYKKYTCIFSSYMAANDERLRALYNAEEPL